jgi:cyclopropane fatty-acyl-phospholipid synthase-like methyltransferase
MQAAGLELRHLESLREHYALTLRHWVRNLESSWDEAVAEVGIARARIWRLYMAGSALGFEAGPSRCTSCWQSAPTAARAACLCGAAPGDSVGRARQTASKRH